MGKSSGCRAAAKTSGSAGGAKTSSKLSSSQAGQTVAFNSPEFQKLLPTIDDKMTPIKEVHIDGEQTAELVSIFKNQWIMSSKSNLMRYALLYNYGGAWMDTDVLLVQDLAPILEEDWAVLMYKNFVNQAPTADVMATLSVSRPASPFITAWLRNILKMGLNTKWAAYGPYMITRMTREVQDSLASKNFHVLPNCFFEGALNSHAVLSDQRTTGWGNFFQESKATTITERLNYIDPTRSRKDHSTFGYHWHNRWSKPIEYGSLAQAAEKLYGILAASYR
eukprot:Skav217885  [mRNA]  locus=scaffold67:145231:149306:+ [translate_table: standard]